MSRIDITSHENVSKTISICHRTEHYDAMIPVTKKNSDIHLDQEKIKPKKSEPNPKRNKACPCESGLKYRNCCRKRSKNESDINRITTKIEVIQL